MHDKIEEIQDYESSPKKAQTLGRWTEPLFPKYGYQRLGLKKTKENQRICDMCQQKTREIHTVRLGRSARSLTLHVGPTCARIMCDEDTRFRRFRIYNSGDLFDQERQFMITKKWQVSRRGLPYLKVECRGCLFAVLICEGQNKKFSAVIVEETRYGHEIDVIKIGRQLGWHDNIEMAKQAAFVWFALYVLDINIYDYLFNRE